MFDSFKKQVDENFSFLKKSKLLIAASGGLDSTVLLALCRMMNLQFDIVHCNFKLRTEESDLDEIFVSNQGEKYETKVWIRSFDCKSYANFHKISIQMAARALRYEWFEVLRKKEGYSYILTAHHADDNLETFLINLSRGCGLEGLIGIPAKNGFIIRPLLSFSRAEIKTFAQDRNLSWREDASNTSDKYLRNRIRHQIVPLFKTLNPAFLESFLHSVDHLQESASIIRNCMKEMRGYVVYESGDEIVFDISKLRRKPNYSGYLYYLLKDYGFTQWKDIRQLLLAQSGKQVFSKTHRLLKDREVLILTEIANEKAEDVKINPDEHIVKCDGAVLHFEAVELLKRNGLGVVFVNRSLMHYPLVIRKWKAGDFFYPEGMSGRKKLSKYFKDEKLSLLDKEKTLLLCNGDGKVIWVIGRRMDRRFSATKFDENLLKIELKQGE